MLAMWPGIGFLDEGHLVCSNCKEGLGTVYDAVMLILQVRWVHGKSVAVNRGTGSAFFIIAV